MRLRQSVEVAGNRHKTETNPLRMWAVVVDGWRSESPNRWTWRLQNYARDGTRMKPQKGKCTGKPEVWEGCEKPLVWYANKSLCLCAVCNDRRIRSYKGKGPPIKAKAVRQKRTTEIAIYKKKRKQYLEENPTCERCGIWGASDLHHKAGRAGKRLYDETNFMAVCRNCHDYIHRHPKESIEKGWLEKRTIK